MYTATMKAEAAPKENTLFSCQWGITFLDN